MASIYNKRKMALWDQFNADSASPELQLGSSIQNPVTQYFDSKVNTFSATPELQLGSSTQNPVTQYFDSKVNPFSSTVGYETMNSTSVNPVSEILANQKASRQQMLQDIIDKSKMTRGQGILAAMGQMNNDYSHAVSGKAALGQGISNLAQAIGSGIVTADRNNADLQKQLETKNYFDVQDAEQQTALQTLKDKANAEKELNRKIYEASNDSRTAYINALNAGKLPEEAAKLLSKGYAATTSKYGVSNGVLYDKENGKIVKELPKQVSDKGYQLGNGVVLNKTTGKWEQLPIADEWQVVPGSKGTQKMNKRGEIQSITNVDYSKPGEVIAPERLTPDQVKTVETSNKISKGYEILNSITSPERRDALNSYGGVQSNLPSFIQPANIGGTAAAGVKAELEYLGSTEYSTNVEMMKGMGALSDAEGKRLSSLTSLMSDPKIADTDRLKYINESKGIYLKGLENMRARNPNLPLEPMPSTQPKPKSKEW